MILGEKERLFKCLYYADMSPNNKQYIQDLIDDKNYKIVQLIKEKSKAINFIKSDYSGSLLDFKKDLLKILSGDEE